jgi:hypothetical protein
VTAEQARPELPSAGTQTEGLRAKKTGRSALMLALVVGLGLRAGVFWHTSALGTEIVDEQHYANLAANILAGNGFASAAGHPTSIRPPLYPSLVAAVWAVAGVRNLQAVRLVQIGLALATALVTGLIGRRVFGPTVGRYAAAVVWLYPTLLFFNFLILTEILFTLLLVAFLLFAVMVVQKPRASTAVSCGVLLGLAALARSILWPTPLVLCPLLVVLIRASWRRRLALAAAVFAAYAMVVGPWAVRNTRLQHVPEVVDTMGGMNLRMGNYEYTPEDRMWDAVALQGTQNWIYAFTQEHPGEMPTEGEKDKWAQHKAVEYMLANPGTTLRRALIKFADLWGLEREFIAGVQQGLFAPPLWFAVSASVVILLAYVAVALAGGTGIWLAAPDWRSHVVLLVPVVLITGLHSIVFGHSRYHLPLVPILALYGSALVVGRRNLQSRVSRTAIVGAAITVVVLLASWTREVAFVDADRVRAILRHLL